MTHKGKAQLQRCRQRILGYSAVGSLRAGLHQGFVSGTPPQLAALVGTSETASHIGSDKHTYQPYSHPQEGRKQQGHKRVGPPFPPGCPSPSHQHHQSHSGTCCTPIAGPGLEGSGQQLPPQVMAGRLRPQVLQNLLQGEHFPEMLVCPSSSSDNVTRTHK